MASYNIYRYTSDASGSASLIGNARTNYFVDGGRTGDTEYFYWVKAVDTSGNESTSFSTTASATPTNVTSDDIVTLAGSKVLIDGTTYLSNWRKTGDLTKIDGGSISTGSITTGQLNFTPVQDTDVIASINASAEGITIDADNLTIAATTTFTSGWAAASNAESDINVLNTTNAPAAAGADVTGDNTAAAITGQGALATLNTISTSECDTTIIDGGKIVTGLLTADNIQAGTLAADYIGAGSITSKAITLAITPGGGDVKIQAGKTDFGQWTTTGFILGIDDSDSDTTKLEITGGNITSGIVQTASTGKRIVITSADNSLTAYDASDITKGSINGTYGSTIFGRTIDSDYAAEFIKDDGASGDVADSGDAFAMVSQGQGGGLLLSCINATANGPNLIVSTNATGQPRIRMGDETALPSTGTHAVGDKIVVRGIEFICTAAGTPGTFESVSGNYYYGTAGTSVSADEWVGLGQNTTTTITTIDKDTWVDEDNPTTNYGSSSDLTLQTLDAGGGEIAEIYVKFDLTSVPDTDDNIYQVLLRLRCVDNSIDNSTWDIGVKNITSAWTEGTVTWNTKPTTSTAVYGTETMSSATATPFWVDVDITELYMGWIDGSVDDTYGLCIYIDSSDVSGAVDSSVDFESNDGDADYSPRLIVYHQGDKTKLYKTNANNGNNTYKVKGVAIHAASSDGDPLIVQTAGHYRGWAASTLIANKKYYLADTEGEMSDSPGTYFKPVAVGIDADEMIIDIKPGFHVQQFEIDGTAATPLFQTGSLYTTTGFRPSRCEIFASTSYGAGSGWSNGVQIEDDASCQYVYNAGSNSTSNHRTDYSFMTEGGTDEIYGDLLFNGSGYKIVLASLNTTNVNSFLTIKAYE